jgi:tRNA(Ile)-lysidine synthase
MLPEKFIENIKEQKLFQWGDTLLLAVSGGIDSVVLCHLCLTAGYRFEIAHVNFGLRGAESDEDEQFVRQLADNYQVPVAIKNFETAAYAANMKLSIQEAARELRYKWFNELTASNGKRIVTAHHADDNVETVLMNFFRGTGISGLRGILPSAGNIVRPLLPFTKNELTAYAQQNHLQWREDGSNASEKYSRNYFRNTIIPLVTKVYPEASKNVLNNISRFRDMEVLYHQAIDAHKKNLLESRGNEVHIPILKLARSQPLVTIVFEIVRKFGFTAHQLNEVIHLLNGKQGSFVQSETHRIFRNRKWLIISPVKGDDTNHLIIEQEDERVLFPLGFLDIIKTPVAKINIEKSPDVALLDFRKISFPLILRKWKTADYFYPLGLGKKKKISRFLIDLKLSATDKEKVWVLESNMRICWVAGMRIDDRFKIVDSTESVLKVKLNRKD